MVDEIPIELKKEPFSLIELSKFTVDFQTIQSPEGIWIYCLQFYPAEDNISIEPINLDYRIEKVNAVLIHSRGTYSQWEYAAEAAIDIIELLGFVVDDMVHKFNVTYWDKEKNDHIIKTGVYENLEFHLEK